MRSVHGPTADWSATEHLLAVVADLLAAANWQRGGDKKKQRPKPLPRPGDFKASKKDPAELRARLLAHRERTRRR